MSKAVNDGTIFLNEEIKVEKLSNYSHDEKRSESLGMVRFQTPSINIHNISPDFHKISP